MTVRAVVGLLCLMTTTADEEQHYRPNTGYEPYWVNMVKPTRSPTTTAPTTTGYKACDLDCSPLYNSVGSVCAHVSLSENKFDDCSTYSKYCNGKANAPVSFITFPHYCLFLDAKCKSSPKSKVVLAYIGDCIRHEDPYRPIYNPQEPIDRVAGYLAELKRVLNATTAPGPAFETSPDYSNKQKIRPSD